MKEFTSKMIHAFPGFPCMELLRAALFSVFFSRITRQAAHLPRFTLVALELDGAVENVELVRQQFLDLVNDVPASAYGLVIDQYMSAQGVDARRDRPGMDVIGLAHTPDLRHLGRNDVDVDVARHGFQ